MPYKDPEKAKERTKRYYQENKEKMNAVSREYYQENKEAVLQHERERRINPETREVVLTKNKERYQANREKRLEQVKTYQSKPEVRETRKQYSKQYYQQNKHIWQDPDKRDEKISYKIAYRQKLRQLCIEHYSNGTMKCMCPGCDCSNYEFLSIDHINGGGLKHLREIKINLTAWLVKNNFPPGFRVLCYNCNLSRGNMGYCPHEKQGFKSDEIVT